MTWKALYVTGRVGFDQEVARYLDKLDVQFMTGSFNSSNTYLFWITDAFNLDDFKKSIGSKAIFKYRLRFFFNVNSFINYRDVNEKKHNFNTKQEQMFRDYFKNLKSPRYPE